MTGVNEATSGGLGETASGSAPSTIRTGTPPTFTVTMTVLNMDRYLEESLGSVLPDLAPDGELVVVDSASTDGTTERLRKLEGQGRLRLHVESCSRGRGRQIGLEMARGRTVVTQVDADVRYSKGLIRRVVQEHERRGRPGLLIVVGRRDRDPGNSKVLVWDLAFYRSTPGYPDWPWAEEIEAIRHAIVRGEAQRFLVDLVGEDLGHLTGQREVPDQPWKRRADMTQVARYRYGEGWTFRAYLRFLWLTRRTLLRFFAGVGVAGLARMRSPLRYPHLSAPASKG